MTKKMITLDQVKKVSVFFIMTILSTLGRAPMLLFLKRITKC